MSIFSRLQSIAAGIAKYGALANSAVAQVQAEIGPSNGDPSVQATKKQTAVTYILAAAHAGESVPVPQVQLIATVVDLAASTAAALGLFGKSPNPKASVSVPAGV